jgi:hypothetical protein
VGSAYGVDRWCVLKGLGNKLVGSNGNGINVNVNDNYDDNGNNNVGLAPRLAPELLSPFSFYFGRRLLSQPPSIRPISSVIA